jgi:spermidine synthase
MTGHFMRESGPLPPPMATLLLLLLLGLGGGGAEDELAEFGRSGVPVGAAARRRQEAVRLGPQCADAKPEQCGHWAATGECRNNAAYMRLYCRRSCDLCDGSPSIVFMEESDFGRIFVVDEGSERHLRFDQWQGDDQSTVDLADPSATPMEYIRFASLLGTAFGRPSPARALAVGLGGGGFVATAHAALPNATVEAVDVDATVVRVAREYFGLARLEALPSPRLRLAVDDGGAYLERQQSASIDCIFVDCYIAGVPSDHSDIPQHIVSDGFFQLLRSRLRPAGLAVINIAENDATAEMAIVSRFSQAFSNVLLPAAAAATVRGGSGGGGESHQIQLHEQVITRPLSEWARARLVRVLAAMRDADSASGAGWADTLAAVLTGDDGSRPAAVAEAEVEARALVVWLGARLQPFYGTAVALGWSSREEIATIDQSDRHQPGHASHDSARQAAAEDSAADGLCGYLTAAALERILEDSSSTSIRRPGSCTETRDAAAAGDQQTADGRVTTGCLALLTPESTNLLLVGQA